MSHQKYPSHDPVKEPHSVSVKVLRLSQPSLETQYPIALPLSPDPSTAPQNNPASLAYTSSSTPGSTNTDPFLLSPIVNLPASFGSAYVGETFSCTLCANNDLPGDLSSGSGSGSGAGAGKQQQKHKEIRDVRVEAEMKTPGLGGTQTLDLGPAAPGTQAGQDLAPGETLQKVLAFDLKEEGNHVLAVTVSYYEATETSGRTRTFRKLYQFICKPSLIVRTKVSALDGGLAKGDSSPKHTDLDAGPDPKLRRWVLEAQLENCSEEVMMLEKVVLDVEDYLGYEDCNWDVGRGEGGEGQGGGDSERPVLHPGEVEQVCFVVGEKREGRVMADGRVMFGVLGIGWRGEMGKRGFLSTGKLGARVAA